LPCAGHFRSNPDSRHVDERWISSAWGHIQTFEKQKAPAPGRIEGIDHDNAIASSTYDFKIRASLSSYRRKAAERCISRVLRPRSLCHDTQTGQAADVRTGEDLLLQIRLIGFLV
jgi:hypothetical protein